MHLKSIRRMHDLCFDGGWWRWTHQFLLVIWLSLLAATPTKASGHFLGDTKAVLNGCEDHWTLQDRAAMPLLFQMTLCVDIRVVAPGSWVAFSYSSVHAPRPELGLEGDDEALYGWLLKVRHRFPIRLSPTHWHRICLRMDVQRKTFSLEVDGEMVAERRVIAQAIPPHGSLWLGCRPRDRPRQAALGEVELYMFRMWADLGDHGHCEDGTVIGWNAQYWGVTHARARQRDPNLQCADHRRLRRGARPKRSVTNATTTGVGRSFSTPLVSTTATTSSPAIATSVTQVPGSQSVNCNISQLCSNNNAYFWMPISVEVIGGNKTEQDVQNLVSNAFRCRSDGGDAARVNGSIDFCQGGRQFQAVQVNCSAKSNISQTTCEVLLQLRRAVSACEVQRAGVSALQQAGDQQIQARITGDVERVAGRDFCGDMAPSSGGFVSCTSTSSLEDICGANRPSRLTCSLIEPNSNPTPRRNPESCISAREAPRFCDCSAFCNSTSQFFATTININNSSVNVSVVQGLLSGANAARACNTMSGSVCQDILRRYQHVHLDCHGTQQRLYSCVVMLEMSGPVNGCSLSKFVQQLIDSNSGITTKSPLTRMVVCGSPGLTVPTLLASNLTWVESDQQTSDVCQPDPTLLKCEANESLAVLLTDGCPPEPTQPSNMTNSNITTTPEASTPSVTNNTTNNTTDDSDSNLNNGTITTSNTTTSTNITTTTVSQNQTDTDFNNTTSTTAGQVNVTLNATASTNNSTVDNVTTVFDNATEPTAAPLSNQTGNHTTASVTHNVTTTNGTDNFTTAATSVSLNQTAGIGFNVSSTASSLTTDFNPPTNEPGVNFTTTETLQTTTLTSTTTTTPGTTSTTTSATTISQEVLEEKADELLNQTQNAPQLGAPQIRRLLVNVGRLLDGPTISEAVAQKIINIISNLMEANSLVLAITATSLIRLVDEVGIKVVVTSEKVILSAKLLVLAVKEVDGTNFPTSSIDILNTDNVQLRGRSGSRFRRSGSAMGSVFLPSSLTTGLSPEQQHQANRVQFNYYAKPVLFQDAALGDRTVISPVLAASVANLSISNLTENIQFTIRNIEPITVNYNASCAFWDFTHNGGGGWRSDGCFLVNTTPEETTCSCNHLTSFAILLDLSRQEIDPRNALILTFITYIGCGISSIFLAVTLLTYLLFNKLLRDIPAKILVQLCMSLLLLNLVFLLDGWLALYPAVGLCISTAFFLHYFLLTTFTWAGLEALHMYLSIVRVFTPYLSRYMLKISLIGWGLPLIVVTIVIAVDKDNYGLVTYGRFTNGTSDDFCWLRNDIAFYVGVVAYFLVVFVLCVVIFIVVMVQLARIKKQNPQNQAPNRGVMTDMRSIAGLIVLLGLTWGFALFAWGPLYLPFVYLFSIFNSLQGFFVFVFHCAVKESVRREWRVHLCCGKLRLTENSEWSRTATQRNRHLSSITAASPGPQFTTRSISVTSDSTNSSESVFADSGISESSPSDSPINEIHRRTLLP
ncbi:uncharacterized protein adgrg2a isoform X2 [Sebastes fasciatus]|uniref:uncharacterized protein adgrg2a isoform X2 n=1 Tax=Sebastes fasciatus TaxID=394691 RepID=UPI003D9F63DA